MDKIDDNNSRTNPSEKFDDYTQNPWTRQAARERNKRKKRNASDGKASEPLSKSIDALPKEQNYAPKVKQQRQRIGVLARTFDIGTAPHRQALDQSVFDASVREPDSSETTSVIDAARKDFEKPDRMDYGVVDHDALHVERGSDLSLKKRKARVEPMNMVISRLGKWILSPFIPHTQGIKN